MPPPLLLEAEPLEEEGATDTDDANDDDVADSGLVAADVEFEELPDVFAEDMAVRSMGGGGRVEGLASLRGDTICSRRTGVSVCVFGE